MIFLNFAQWIFFLRTHYKSGQIEYVIVLLTPSVKDIIIFAGTFFRMQISLLSCIIPNKFRKLSDKKSVSVIVFLKNDYVLSRACRIYTEETYYFQYEHGFGQYFLHRELLE